MVPRMPDIDLIKATARYQLEYDLSELVYLNLDNTLVTGELEFWQFSPGSTFFPHIPQEAPSLFKNGLWEAHVPLNLPPFTKMSRTDINKKKTPNNRIPSKTVVILFFYFCAKLIVIMNND